jgi:hypothetical protein
MEERAVYPEILAVVYRGKYFEFSVDKNQKFDFGRGLITFTLSAKELHLNSYEHELRGKIIMPSFYDFFEMIGDELHVKLNFGCIKLTNVLNDIEEQIEIQKRGRYLISPIYDKKWSVVYKGSIFSLSLTSENNCFTFIIDKCIQFSYCTGTQEISLDSYYYDRKCRGKQTIPHATFFKFLDLFAHKFKVREINLQDVSVQHLNWCNLPVEIFAMAGRQTFYGRYGFENPAFDAKMRKIGDMFIDELVNLVNKIKDKWVDDLLKEEPDLGETRVKTLAENILVTCKEAEQYEQLPKNIELKVTKANKHLQLIIKLFRKYHSQLPVKSQPLSITKFFLNQSQLPDNSEPLSRKTLRRKRDPSPHSTDIEDTDDETEYPSYRREYPFYKNEKKKGGTRKRNRSSHRSG